MDLDAVEPRVFQENDRPQFVGELRDLSEARLQRDNLAYDARCDRRLGDLELDVVEAASRIVAGFEVDGDLCVLVRRRGRQSESLHGEVCGRRPELPVLAVR